MTDRGILPELEIFDTGMAYLAHELLHRRVIEQPLYANLILGGPNTAPATAHALTHLIDALPIGTTWAAAVFGAFQLAMNALAVFMGGHVRTGLEDSLWMDPRREHPATNVDLVERIVELAHLAGRPVATASHTRGRLGLPLSQPASAP